VERNEVVTGAGSNPTGGKLGRLAGGIDSSLKCKKGPPDEAPDKAPGEESDEAPKLENANQRFAFSLISDQHGSYLVKKLSDRLSMPRFLGTTRVARWSPTYRRSSA